MPPGSGETKGPNQRRRLEDAILNVVAEDGYLGTRVAEIAKRAGVSTATFYEFFADKDAGFIATHRRVGDEVLAAFQIALAGAAPEETPYRALDVLVGLATGTPEVLLFLTHEALIAGKRGRERHDEFVSQLEASLTDASDQPERDWSLALRFGIPPKLLLGAMIRLLGMKIRAGARVDASLTDDLRRWVDTYTAAEGAERRLDFPQVSSRRGEPDRRPNGPRTLPRGRHRLPKDVVESIQRERIAYATAQVLEERDTVEIAVSDIVAAAGVSRTVFYANFKDKEDALAATQQMVFERLMTTSVGAFFKPEAPWPQRVWEAGLAFAQMLAAEPTFAHFAFVSAYRIGEAGVRSVDERVLAFGLFLEDGYRATPEAGLLPRTVSDAVAAAVMELAAFYVREDRVAELPSLVPLVVYVATAPFMGSEAAYSYVRERQLQMRTHQQ